MKKIIMLVAVIALLGVSAAAMAAMSSFETFTTGVSVNGQSGWTVEDAWGNQTDFNSGITGVQRPDEQIVNDNGNSVWRISNAYTRTTYADQVFSQQSEAVAGETGSSLWNDFGPNHTTPYNPAHFGANATTNLFHSSFDFRSVTGVAQYGLGITLSPSAKQSGVRMSYLNISDNGQNGFDLLFYDTSNGFTTVATGLSYTGWHSIAMDVMFIDGVNNTGGQINGNDLVKIYVDGSLAHTGTTWESYYYAAERIVPTDPRLQAVDSILFRVAGTAAPTTLGNGFYFDNIEVSNGPVAAVPEPATILGFGIPMLMVGLGKLRGLRK